MAKIEELTQKVEQLERLLKARGIQADPVVGQADYIAHGSPQHAAFLGLVEAKEGDISLITFTSPRTGKKYRLEDEMGATRYFPHIDPDKAVLLTLQQKVNELEIPPTVPEDAQQPFRPEVVYSR